MRKKQLFVSSNRQSPWLPNTCISICTYINKAEKCVHMASILFLNSSENIVVFLINYSFFLFDFILQLFSVEFPNSFRENKGH